MSWIHWNPDHTAFFLPYFRHPVTWYGLLFSLGFVLSYYLLRAVSARFFAEAGIDRPKEKSLLFADRLVLYAVLGTLIGARLGEVLFYDWSHYSAHPLDILKTWQGGLASHGGALGILLALLLFYQKEVKGRLPFCSFTAFLDLFCLPVPLAGALIRLGNFVNQEIVGRPSSMPWSVLFAHPAGGHGAVPRHPVQLYEALAYLAIFAALYTLWRIRGTRLKQGTLSGLFFLGVFGCRFLLEFYKMPQNALFAAHSPLLMGQLLSLPFIAAGLILLFSGRAKGALLQERTPS